MSLPTKTNERIQYVQAHIAPFETNTLAIGLVSADVADLEARAEAARAAFDLRQSLWQQAEAVTEQINEKVELMNVAWSACTDKIKAKAKQVGGTSVYTLAQIPAPATPTPSAPPGEPTDFTATLQTGGDVELGWACVNPPSGGTTYQVYRRFILGAAWEFCGASGEKKYIDSTIPAGVQYVMYKIRGIRPTAAGPWGEFNVTFGAGAGSEGATVTAVVAPKIAA